MKCDQCNKRVYIPKKYQNYPDAIWIFFGEHYGYPKCCIANFVNYSGDKIQKVSKKNARNGYVPCPRCCRVLKKGIKIEELIKNRKCVKKY